LLIVILPPLLSARDVTDRVRCTNRGEQPSDRDKVEANNASPLHFWQLLLRCCKPRVALRPCKGFSITDAVLKAALICFGNICRCDRAATPWPWCEHRLKTLDPDNDGTVDLTEAKTAAGKLFDRLDRDRDGTLDRRELRGRLNAKDFAAADPDNDGTVDKNEFLAIVEKRFKAADPDNDGTIDAKEFRSPAGRSLVRLLK
jgi:hypothetical protein